MAKKMNNKTPAKIEQNFRKMLGSINPYMCLVDVAVKEMIKNYKKQDIHIEAKKHGYPNLRTEHMNLTRLSQLVHRSHLLYIQSVAEVATKDLVKIAEASSMVSESKVSFFNRAIQQIDNKKYNHSKCKDSNKCTQNYVGIEETLVINYYRKIRNDFVHGNTDFLESKKYFNDNLNNNLNTIKCKFGFAPNPVNSLTENDVYLSSFVWYSCIKQLSEKCIDIPRDIMPDLIEKYKNYTLKRKQSSIKNILKLEYLLKDKEIDDILKTMVN